MSDEPARPRPARHRRHEGRARSSTRVILDGADLTTAHEAAEGGSCPACVAVAGISFGITLASTVAGDTAFMTEPLRLALLAAVDADPARPRQRVELAGAARRATPGA